MEIRSLHDQHDDQPTKHQSHTDTISPTGPASCTGSNAPGVPAPGVAGTDRCQGAPDRQATTEGGPQPGGKQAESLAKKRQRARQPKERKRLKQPSCRMNDDEFKRLTDAAAHCDMPIAAFLAYAADKAARDLTRTAAEIATEREVINELFAAAATWAASTACSTRSPRPSTPAPTHPTWRPWPRPSATPPAAWRTPPMPCSPTATAVPLSDPQHPRSRQRDDRADPLPLRPRHRRGAHRPAPGGRLRPAHPRPRPRPEGHLRAAAAPARPARQRPARRQAPREARVASVRAGRPGGPDPVRRGLGGHRPPHGRRHRHRPDGDDQACRWAAVRHADDHIHIIATLVRDDGRRPRLHNEARRAQTECRRIEADYNLRRVAPGDGTAAKRPTSAERHKADRQGRDRPAREELHETVRQAVAGAASEAEFFARLKAAGLLIHQRVAPSGDLLGYKVALPGDVNDDGEPIYYAGSTLAPDLSLPRIRERFPTTHDAHGDEQETATRRSAARSRGAVSAPAAARRSATRAAWTVLVTFDQDGDGAAAARIAAAGEMLDTLAQTSAAHTRQQLRDAAWAFERATRSHTRAEYRHAQALRRAARDLRYSGPALGRGEDGATTAMLIDTLFFLATAAAHWHAQRHHAQQAEAARQAAAHLRAAYAAAAEEPIARLRNQGLSLVDPVRDWAAALLRATTPEIAEAVVSEPGWPALAATLTHVYQAGHNPQELLTEAVAHRELDTAGSVSDVLVWRLRRIADLPADAAETPSTRPARHSPPASSPAPLGFPVKAAHRRDTAGNPLHGGVSVNVRPGRLRARLVRVCGMAVIPVPDDDAPLCPPLIIVADRQETRGWELVIRGAPVGVLGARGALGDGGRRPGGDQAWGLHRRRHPSVERRRFRPSRFLSEQLGISRST